MLSHKCFAAEKRNRALNAVYRAEAIQNRKIAAMVGLMCFSSKYWNREYWRKGGNWKQRCVHLESVFNKLTMISFRALLLKKVRISSALWRISSSTRRTNTSNENQPVTLAGNADGEAERRIQAEKLLRKTIFRGFRFVVRLTCSNVTNSVL